MRRFAFAVCALLVLGVTAVSAQDISGTIVRIDAPAHVVILDDGRMWRMTSTSVLLVDNRPVEITTLRPGSRVVLRSWEPVAFRDGQYVVVAQPSAVSPAPSVAAPAPGAPAPSTTQQTTVTTTTTTTTPPAAALTSGEGTVARIDFPAGVIAFTDGRLVQTTPKSVILVNGRPLPFNALQPGRSVVVKDFNPVVSRDGRYVLLNTGYRDPDTGSALTWDSEYAGYEADAAHGGMQVQAP
jgi:hypothetical protein